MKRATVVGGSLTGLAAGILLRKIGWEVNIFERSPQSLSDRGAGIVLQQETLELLRLCGAKGDGDVGVTLNYRKYLDADGSVASYDSGVPGLFCTSSHERDCTKRSGTWRRERSIRLSRS